MVGKSIILLRIQNLKEGCRRITVIGSGKLIHLIQYHDRIGNTRLLYTIHDSTGHGTEIGSSVTADVRLVSYTAKTHANIFSSESLRNALSDTGFPCTGSSHKEENGAGLLLLQIHDRNLLNHPFLNLL